MPFGLLNTGWSPKTLEDTLAEIDNDIKLFKPDANLTAGSLLGNIVSIFSVKLTDLWEAGSAIYSAFDPDQAGGEALTQIASITGTVRKNATKSVALVDVVTAGNVSVVAGGLSISVIGNTDAVFVNQNDINIPTPGTYSLVFEATVAGATLANVGTLTVIDTPVTNLTSVNNPADATIGLEVETDIALRGRRIQELQAPGTGTLEAIRVDILKLSGVTEVAVFDNTSDATDIDGVPAHQFEAVVRGGVDQAIADALWVSTPAGIRSHGSVSSIVVDSAGVDQTVKFSRPALQTILLEIDVTIDPSTYGGDSVIIEAVVAWAQIQQHIESDLIISQIIPVVFGVSGVVDVSDIRASISPSTPSANNVSISARQLADVQSSNIVVATV